MDKLTRLVNTVGKSTMSRYGDGFKMVADGTMPKEELIELMTLDRPDWKESSIITKVNTGVRIHKEYNPTEIYEAIILKKVV